jgi:MoaA/NifB/PqqE/SkfB family radical SAM enzyme
MITRFLQSFVKKLKINRPHRKQSVFFPQELHIELTYSCNTECIMCNLRYLKTTRKELTLDQLKNVLAGSKALEAIGLVVLSGGEAMLRKDFIEIAMYLCEKFPAAKLLILTNFFDTKKILKIMNELKKNVDLSRFSLSSSLDGIGARHDRIRGRKGSFGAFEETLYALRQFFPKVCMSVNFTVTPENCSDIMPVWVYCKSKTLPVSYQVLVQKKETEMLVWSRAKLDVLKSQINELIEEIWESSGLKDPKELLSRQSLLHDLLTLYYIPIYIEHPGRYFSNCPCGHKFIMLDPYGTLYFCPVHKEKTAGNVLDDGLDKVWSGVKASEARAFFDKETCHCWLTCTNRQMLENSISGKFDEN